MTAFVLIIHDVEDYTAWKAVFDQAADMRALAGERHYQVLTDQKLPNRVVHFSQWTSHEAAQRFFQSPELVEIRKSAGVKAPDFIYLNEREAGDLEVSREQETEAGGNT
ncbi:antibiotic biosynthesis monooxygenase [Asticcacaulis sp.]|uniref:antibiotic biosynthesis monooxygenase n=1 Tax=Asticcacaulis sp. TaxID=1872648 RepID=UPI00260EF483|nr:antibiotic biosynthesis monooxygenase [Asticcacaulis sp.]